MESVWRKFNQKLALSIHPHVADNAKKVCRVVLFPAGMGGQSRYGIKTHNNKVRRPDLGDDTLDIGDRASWSRYRLISPRIIT